MEKVFRPPTASAPARLNEISGLLSAGNRLLGADRSVVVLAESQEVVFSALNCHHKGWNRNAVLASHQHWSAGSKNEQVWRGAAGEGEHYLAMSIFMNNHLTAHCYFLAQQDLKSTPHQRDVLFLLENACQSAFKRLEIKPDTDFSILNAIDDAVIVRNHQRKIIFFNRRAAHYAAQDKTGEAGIDEELYPWSNQLEKVEQALFCALDGGSRIATRNVSVSDKKEFEVSIQHLIDSDLYLETIRDVSARALMNRTNKHYKSLLDIIDGVITDFDQIGDPFSLWSKLCASMMSISGAADAMIVGINSIKEQNHDWQVMARHGFDSSDFIIFGDGYEFLESQTALLADCLENGTVQTRNNEIHQDRLVVQNMIALPITSSGRVVGALVIANIAGPFNRQALIDSLSSIKTISLLLLHIYQWAAELEQANKTMRSAAERAARASQVKSEFMASMSHELRTPLTSIIGFSDVLINRNLEDVDPDKRRDMLKSIRKSASSLSSLVGDVMELTRIESENVKPSFSRTQLNSQINRVIQRLLPETMEKNISIFYQSRKDETFISTDESILQRILENLITNAVRYNKPDGIVEISHKTHPDGEVRIAIKDSGIGISEPEMANIFTPFNRAGKHNSAIEGTGIGLTLCRRLAPLIDATVTASSELGVGSEFALTIMSAKREAIESSHHNLYLSNAVNKNGKPHYQVVYVEDSPASREMVEGFFDCLDNITLHCASNTLSGLDLIRQVNPDLILMDIELPELSGIEATKLIRQDKSLSHIEVVACAAYLDDARNEAMTQAGINHIMLKPVSFEELGQLVDTLLYNVVKVKK